MRDGRLAGVPHPGQLDVDEICRQAASRRWAATPAELLPVVADPLVGGGTGQSCPEYYSQDGIYLSINRPGDIEKSFAALGLGARDVDIIVASDGEQIPGIGDGGVGGGMQVATGTLAIYTAAAGIRPNRVIPVALPPGTDNQALRGDRSTWAVGVPGVAVGLPRLHQALRANGVEAVPRRAAAL